MKQQRITNRNSRRRKKAISNGRPSTLAHGMEQLEDRYLLAANILGSTVGAVSPDGKKPSVHEI